MQPTLAPTTQKAQQQRLRRFKREPERLQNRELTDKGLEAMAVIERYRFIPTSLLIRLMPGDGKNNHRHLQTLYHRGLVNRFALPKYGGPGEFIYYLDGKPSLDTLISQGLIQPTEGEYKRKLDQIRLNRETNYSSLRRDPDTQGRVLYIQHELMVTRFHALLELASKKTNGKLILEQWKQGPELWNKVEVPKMRPRGKDDTTGLPRWEELDQLHWLPHRPDAFFTLYFPTKPEGQQRSHFMYEADRGTENTTRFKLKLRAHYHYIVNQHRQKNAPYNVHALRAVLIESTGMQWAQNLREAARENVVSPNPSNLFWFTTSEVFTQPQTVTQAGRQRQVPLYLEQPEKVFKPIWATPVENKFLSLLD